MIAYFIKITNKDGLGNFHQAMIIVIQQHKWWKYMYMYAANFKFNKIYHHIAEWIRESHPSVHDLQYPIRLSEVSESWMLWIMDTIMGFLYTVCNVVIDYFSHMPFNLLHLGADTALKPKSNLI